MCSRVLYSGEGGLVITGRSMDWSEDIYSNVWVFPRGAKRDGASGAHTVRWTSKYGSLGISAYEKGIADGMNEKGLGHERPVSVGIRLWQTRRQT